jgi:hypothetical protein
VKQRKGLDVSVAKVKLDDARTFGVEFEFCAPMDREDMAQTLRYYGVDCYHEYYNHETRDHWKLVSDGSLDGDWQNDNDWTMELVSPPLSGREGLAEVSRVLECLNDSNCTVNSTCGLHVHHDARDLSLPAFRILAKAALKYEDVLDELVAGDRVGNYYCRSLRWNGYTVEDMAREIDGTHSVSQLADLWTRFTKVNFEAYGLHGTVEFRQHHGTLDLAETLAWISLTQGMVARAASEQPLRFKKSQRPFDGLVWAAGLNACVERHFRAKYRQNVPLAFEFPATMY